MVLAFFARHVDISLVLLREAVSMLRTRAGLMSASGIDLGATAIWVARIEGDSRPSVAAIERVPATALIEVRDLITATACVAIDAPGGLSEGRHLDDTRLAPKFRSARCSEVALRRAGIAVPFVTPQSLDDVPSWMKVGFSVWDVARDSATSVVETYPHGIFWRLAGRPLLHKQSDEGRSARRAALCHYVDLPIGVQLWSHDALDAVACAVLAWLVVVGDGEEINCAQDRLMPLHDGSSLWLPKGDLNRGSCATVSPN